MILFRLTESAELEKFRDRVSASCRRVDQKMRKRFCSYVETLMKRKLGRLAPNKRDGMS